MKIPFFNMKNEANDSPTGSAFDKIKNLFSFEPQKEKVLRHKDFNAAGDVYYANVSTVYKISQRVLILILVVFLLFSVISNFRQITYDNFFYLLKDFSNAVDIESSNYDTLSYTSDTRHFFSLYRGGLVVVNPSNVCVYTATGRNTLNTTSQFSSPCVVSSGKYFLVYDTADTEFAIYNSFSRVYSESLEYPITDACFAEDGTFAIITRDISHKSIVKVYKNNFKAIFAVPENMYAFDVSMSADEDKLAICYYDNGTGNGNSQIDIYSISDAKKQASISIDGEFLIQSGFLNNGNLAVVTDSSVKIYDKNFDIKTSITYNNAQLTGFDINGYGVAVSYVSNSENLVAIFDENARPVYNETVRNSINDIGLYEGFAFLRTDDGIIRLDLQNKKQAFLPSGQGKMLIYNASTAVVCGPAKAQYITFE